MRKDLSVRSLIGSGTLLVLATFRAFGAPGWNSPPAEQTSGQFWRVCWYERGLTNGNPAFESRFRINSPEVVLHPAFGRRIEARENGLMLIRAEEDLFQIGAAELYLEMWGGHPGTANKRFTVNGRTSYALPKVGTEENNCTYFYPSVPLKISDLVNGYDAFQFTLDQGTTFWGHALIDNACLRLALTNSHPDVLSAGLAQFEATVDAASADDSINLTLRCPDSLQSRISTVEFQGWYSGYDENGDGRDTDWHGFTKARASQAHLGTVARPPFRLQWHTDMAASQTDVAVRALVRFKDTTNLVFLTRATSGLHIPERAQGRVSLLHATDLPKPFWSRANQKKWCSIRLENDPAEIEKAELHVLLWDGGFGSIASYFTLNGVPMPVAGKGRHDLIYTVLPIDPKLLRKGSNQIEVLSDTEHHGLEILLPGPALVIRTK